MIEFNFSELKRLQKQLEGLATEKELEKADAKAFKRIEKIIVSELKSVLPTSEDVSKSGRKGSRTFTHAKDNIPISINKVDGRKELTVGWKKGDNSPFYYMKFVEFGSSKVPPQAPFKKTFIRQVKEYNKILVEEYENLLEERLGV